MPRSTFHHFRNRRACDISISTETLRGAFVITGWDYCILLCWMGPPPPQAMWRLERVKKQKENVRFLLGIRRHSTLAKFCMFFLKEEKKRCNTNSPTQHTVKAWIRRKRSPKHKATIWSTSRDCFARNILVFYDLEVSTQKFLRPISGGNEGWIRGQRSLQSGK